MDELLPCWRSKVGVPMSVKKYKDLLDQNRSIIHAEYFKTFFKSATRIRLDKAQSAKTGIELLRKQFDSIGESLPDGDKLELKMKALVDSILKKNLLNWVPGKEIRKHLVGEGYSFNDENFDFKHSGISIEVRKILMKK
jgi:phage-related tail protein